MENSLKAIFVYYIIKRFSCCTICKCSLKLIETIATVRKMIIELSLTNFRNFDKAQLQLSPGLNIILGDNGMGKSNLLEAAYLCGFGRSFRGKGHTYVRFGEEFCRIDGKNMQNDVVQVIYLSGGTRNILFNGKKLMRISELLGRFPGTYVGPQEVQIVSGAPSQRRKLLDEHICQFDPIYTQELYNYNRSVQQRNASLRQVARNEIAGGMILIETIDEKVAEHGANVIRGRLKFIEELTPIASEIFSTLTGENTGELNLEYISAIADNPAVDNLAQIFMEKLAGHRSRDRKFFQTTVGPHRDDLNICIGELAAKYFASWGQARMISLGLYLGAAKLLSERVGRVPTLLLDDALAELDPNRAGTALELLPVIGQTIVATPHPSHLDDIENCKKFVFSEPGKLRREIEQS